MVGRRSYGRLHLSRKPKLRPEHQRQHGFHFHALLHSVTTIRYGEAANSLLFFVFIFQFSKLGAARIRVTTFVLRIAQGFDLARPAA